MRTQAILLVRDATFLLNVWSDDGECAMLGQSWSITVQPSQRLSVYRSSQWRRSCDHLVALLDEYSNTLLHAIERFVEIDDNGGAEMIWSSCITCLTYLTALCELVGRTDPTASLAMNGLCDCNLEKLGRLTEDMRSEEYTHLDLLLGVSAREFSRLRLKNDTDGKTDRLVFLEKIIDRV